MRLVTTEYLSLDAAFHEPGQWSHPFFNEEAMQFKWVELQPSDAQLLGRNTCEGFAAAWPGMRKTTGEFGEKINDMTKYVVSSTLAEATWPVRGPEARSLVLNASSRHHPRQEAARRPNI